MRLAQLSDRFADDERELIRSTLEAIGAARIAGPTSRSSLAERVCHITPQRGTDIVKPG